MPTVPAQTEANNYFRAVEALVFAIFGTLLVIFSIQAIKPNYIGITFAALGSVSVIVPAILAMRRASRNKPAEPTIHFKHTERLISLSNLVYGLLLIFTAWFVPNHGHGRFTVPALAVVLALYLSTTAWLVDFVPFYSVGVAVVVASIFPFYTSAPATAPAVSGLVTGFLLWISAFLVFSRATE
jgi:hypothetical protein